MRIALVFCFVFLAGCSSLDMVSVKAPTPEEVVAYVKETRVNADAIEGLTPREYLTASIVHSNQRCKDFFIQISRFQRNSSMLDKVLNAAVAAGAPLYPIYGVSQTAQTLFTTIVAGAGTVNGAAREIYAFASYSEELSQLVSQAQNVYLEGSTNAITVVSTYSNGELTGNVRTSINGNDFLPFPMPVAFIINDVGNVTRDEAFLLARYVSQGYAYQCSLASINKLIKTSILNAKVGDANNGARGGRAPAAGMPGIEPNPSAVAR